MNIEIVTKHVKNDTGIRDFIQERVHVALDRINTRVNRVTVRLEDETPNSDAWDGLCQIDVSLEPSGHIHVSANGSSGRETVQNAIRKMEHAIKHDIDRNRSSSRIRHEKSKQKFYGSLSEPESTGETT